VKFRQKLRKRKQDISLADSVKTIGDWIQVKRIEKNLSVYHLSEKMGIASALVHTWEDGTSQPDSRQLEVLTNILGLDPVKYALTFPRKPGKEPAAFEQVMPKT